MAKRGIVVRTVAFDKGIVITLVRGVTRSMAAPLHGSPLMFHWSVLTFIFHCSNMEFKALTAAIRFKGHGQFICSIGANSEDFISVKGSL